MTLETCDESDEETRPDQQKDTDKYKDNDNDKDNDKYIYIYREDPQRVILETFDL